MPLALRDSVITAEFQRATEFLVRDLQRIPDRIKWSAALLGLRIRSVDGEAVGYRPSTAIRRTYWLGPQFQHQEPALASLIRSAAGLADSRWKECRSRQEFLHMGQLRQRTLHMAVFFGM